MAGQDPTALLARESTSILMRGPLLAWACVLLAPSFVWGVPAGEVSWSADMVCMLRAIASQHPDPTLRNPDHLAQRLCPRPFELRDYASARSEFDAQPQAWAGYFYVNARTHYIDALLERAVQDGVTQVVILGAGFDSRAWRFHGAYPELRFFELDRPETIAAKKRRLSQAFIALHQRVRLVNVDFDTQPLDQVLPAHGYDAARRTLFILEGVTMYVSETGSAATFDFIRRHSAPGSRIVCDYMLRDALADPCAYYGMAFASEMLAQRGEPLVSGWSRADAAALLKAHGLERVSDLSGEDLGKRYLVGLDGRLDGRMLEGNRIFEARVV